MMSKWWCENIVFIFNFGDKISIFMSNFRFLTSSTYFDFKNPMSFFCCENMIFIFNIDIKISIFEVIRYKINSNVIFIFIFEFKISFLEVILYFWRLNMVQIFLFRRRNFDFWRHSFVLTSKYGLTFHFDVKISFLDVIIPSYSENIFIFDVKIWFNFNFDVKYDLDFLFWHHNMVWLKRTQMK